MRSSERPARARVGARSPGRPARTPRRRWRGRAGRPASAAPAPTGDGGAVGGIARRRPSTVPACRGPAGCSAHSSDDLPEPLRPITATTSPRGTWRSTPAQRDDVAVAHHQPAPVEPAPRVLAAPRATTVTSGRRNQGVEALAEAAGLAAGVAHRQRHRVPAGQAAELHDRRGERRRGRARSAAAERAEPSVEQHDGVGVLHHPLEPVLGHDDGDAEVVDEPGDGGEHLLGGGGVERRGRLVEHEDPRVGGEHRADGDALLLAARERAQGAAAQLGDAEQVERLLHPLAHHRLGARRAAPWRRPAPPPPCRSRSRPAGPGPPCPRRRRGRGAGACWCRGRRRRRARPGGRR